MQLNELEWFVFVDTCKVFISLNNDLLVKENHLIEMQTNDEPK